MKFLVITKKRLIAFALAFAVAVCGAWLLLKPDSVATTGKPQKEYVINMVTGEFKTTTSDGKEIEAYRWDPGTIVVPKDENIKLSLYGVNGKEHPFKIEGTTIKGMVTKGKETVVNLRFNKEGTYRLICTTHSDIAHNGPMIAYIVVD
ncbi:cupredoxin domain-containing protein [Priestia koreensis]|uniref:cupredoxin domain-containing protein n=1 Tax=Priestia koreensis TaxID=284581 RepID=UPI001F565A30|nr:cupredoxin domain-containing protein [Priestia koreensis]MCM3005435.1 cupredoxin domain-containing protein [Priestia koreensis]UNL86644.1 cupredoxin domain-containing protein [Priestia koreensis]